MNDVHLLLRQRLFDAPDLFNVVGRRIYAATDVPPPGYSPGDGPAVCFKVRGGQIHNSDAYIEASVQFKCYGLDETQAEWVYLALCDALHTARGSDVLWAHNEVLGQPTVEPSTEWRYNLSFFQVWVAKEA